MEYLILIAAYTIASLGLLALIGTVAAVWGFVLNRVYITIKANHYFFEYFRYRKEFIRWLKEIKRGKKGHE